ncbi:alpha/beta fold hydrolase [Streptomyces puniciscabiei]
MRAGGDITVSGLARAARADRTFLYRHRDLLERVHAAATAPAGARPAASIPKAHLSVVPHAGHLLPVAAPHAFNAVARGFLDPECRQTQ